MQCIPTLCSPQHKFETAVYVGVHFFLMTCQSFFKGEARFVVGLCVSAFILLFFFSHFYD